MSDVTFGVSERAFKAVFNKVYPTVSLPFEAFEPAGAVWYGVEGEVHIEGAGDIDFEDGNTFLLKELDIGWDKLIFRLGFDIPEVSIGKFCVVRVPDDWPILAGECLFEFPGVTLFKGVPDITIKINLSAIMSFIVTEISGRYGIDIRKDGNYQKVFADVLALDVDPISINDTFGKLPALIQAGILAAASQMLKLVPQAWLLDVALGLLGFPTITSLLLNLLDIEDDLEEWLLDKLNLTVGIDNLLYRVLFASLLEKELFKIEDPFPFVPEIKADVADYGGFPGAAPPGPQFTIPKITAPVLNASAIFDADNLFIRFDFGM